MLAAISPGDVADLVAAITQDDVADEIANWLGDALSTIFSIVLIVVISLAILRVLRAGVQRVVTRVLERQDQTPRELRQKAQTLASVVEGAGRLVVFIIAGIMVLSSLGLEVAPLIASAGVAGLAIGLGAQSLIRDTINGFFILFENQYAVGDVVTIGPDSGTVEEVSLRRTVLRSVNGAVVIIPNGQVMVVQNQSRGWSRAVIDISVTAQADANQVTAVLHELLDDIQSDPELGSLILERPDILGVTAIDATGATFRVLVKTQPLQQWKVERELRRRIWQAFRERGIPTPVLTSATLAPP
jgi:small conductance mechanosensitive channel